MVYSIEDIQRRFAGFFYNSFVEMEPKMKNDTSVEPLKDKMVNMIWV